MRLKAVMNKAGTWTLGGWEGVVRQGQIKADSWAVTTLNLMGRQCGMAGDQWVKSASLQSSNSVFRALPV